MYILRTVWYFVGPYCVQTRFDGGSCEDHHYCKFTNTQLSQEVTDNAWSDRLLQKIYQGLSEDHNMNGEVVKEICEIPMD